MVEFNYMHFLLHTHEHQIELFEVLINISEPNKIYGRVISFKIYLLLAPTQSIIKVTPIFHTSNTNSIVRAIVVNIFRFHPIDVNAR